MSGGVAEQPTGLGDDLLGRSPDQPHVAGGDPLGALGLGAQDKQRHAERRRFFLHPPRVAQNEVAIAHPPDQLAMAARVEQRDVRAAAEQAPQGRGDMGVGRYDDVELRVCGELAYRGGNPGEALGPALAPMTGDEDRGDRPRRARRGGQLADHFQQRVDSGVAGDVDSAWNALAGKVEGGEVGRCEQQVGTGVDLGPIFLLRPGQGAVAGAEAGLDMGERNRGRERGAGTAERARRVALDDQQVGRGREQRSKRGFDPGDMRVGVLLAGAIEMQRGIYVQPMVARIEPSMLAGEDQRGRQPALGERMCEGGELDGFGPGADDQPDVRGLQPSP